MRDSSGIALGVFFLFFCEAEAASIVAFSRLPVFKLLWCLPDGKNPPPPISLIWDCIFALEFAAEVLFFY